MNLLKNLKFLKNLFFAIFIFWSINTFGQSITWEKTYLQSNWTTSYSIKQTNDGNYIVCGLRMNYGGFVLKLNQTGDTLWVRYFPVAEFTSVIETNDGNYIAVGWTNSVYAVKISNVGNILWTQQIIEPNYQTRPYGLCKTNDNKYALVGEAILENSSKLNGYFLKFDENGIKIWAKFFDFKNTHIVFSNVKQLSNNDFILTGGINFQNNSQFYLIRTNSVGDTLWTYIYGTNFEEYCYTVFQTFDKGFLGIGSINFGNGQYKLYFTKTDSSGNLLWAKVYGDTLKNYEIRASDCAVKDNFKNSYIITGRYETGINSQDTQKIFLLSIDSLGNKLWEKYFYKDTVYVEAASIDICRDSGYVIGGDILDPPLIQDLTSPQYLYVIKTNKMGEVTPIGINNNSNEIPNHFQLFPSYPNPFNPLTTIIYTISENSFIILKLYDVLGREIKTLTNERHYPGIYKLLFDGSDIPSGVYILQLQSSTGFSVSQKIVLIK